MDFTKPIDNGTRFQKMGKIKTEINSEILTNIVSGQTLMTLFFIEETLSFIFANNREWKQHKKRQKSVIKKYT